MTRVALIAAVLISPLVAGPAVAQGLTSVNIFAGYSYLNSDLGSSGRTSLNGWNGSIEGRVLPFIGIVADFSGQYGSISPGTCVTPVGSQPGGCSGTFGVSQHNYLFGPRVSFSVGKFRPFAHVLIGASHVGGEALPGSATSLAEALGGGLDYRLIPMVSWRVQADFLHTGFYSATQHDVRISTGLVLRF